MGDVEKVDDSPEMTVPLEPTKHDVRQNIWENMEKNNLVNFPRPVYGRIPNFKDCEIAASKVFELDAFKQAQNIMVNPDKPQEPVRHSVLEQGKNLFVPVPRLKLGLLKHITVPDNQFNLNIRQLVNRKGIDEFGKDIGIHDTTKIDLVIVGSVAVTKEGHRIGKGKGYADLEFAMLLHLKALNPDVTIVTTVHDEQVLDTLPHDIFGLHDVPVDIIVTPTQVIHVEKPLPKPTEIMWNLISQRKLDFMPVLKALYDLEKEAGKEIALKEIESDVDEPKSVRRPFTRIRRVRYFRRRPKTQESETQFRLRHPLEETGNKNNIDNNEVEDEQRNQKPQRKRKFIKRSRNSQTRENNENIGDSKENKNPNSENLDSPKRRQQKRKLRPMIDFSLAIRNIEKTVRVRDVKNALAERGIKPNLITWRGYKGFCYLHFSKTNPNTISDPEQQSHGVDSVLNSLNNLKISPNSNRELVIEIMKPISRIETTDVTAV